MSKQVTRARMEAATGIAGGQTGADADEGIIHGYAVATAGEAKGHGVDLDATTLEQIVELGNASKLGIKSRFGHPSMSGTALGTFLGRARGFWLDTDGEAPVVRANLHLSKSSRNTPQGDLGGYVLGLAGEDPESFGSSVVVSGQHLQRVDEHGNELDEPPVLRVDKLHASDVVDEPAANEGMFDVTMAGEAVGVADGMLDRVGQEKAVAWFGRYAQNRGLTEVILSELGKHSDTLSDTTPFEGVYYELVDYVAGTGETAQPDDENFSSQEGETMSDSHVDEPRLAELESQLAIERAERAALQSSLDAMAAREKVQVIERHQRDGRIVPSMLSAVTALAEHLDASDLDSHLKAFPVVLHNPGVVPGGDDATGEGPAQLSAVSDVIRRLGSTEETYNKYRNVETIYADGTAMVNGQRVRWGSN